MANKCYQCGKFISATDGAKCISGKWSCKNCRSKTKMCSPIKPQHINNESDLDESFSDANLVEDNSKSTYQIINEIRGLRQDLANISRKMDTFSDELTQLHKTVSEQNKSLDAMDRRITALEELDKKKSPELCESDENAIARLRSEMNERDQHYLLTDIELAGIQESPNENPVNIVMLVARKIGETLEERDIVYAERSGPRRFPAFGEDRQERPRPIAVRLLRQAARDKLLRAARVRRNIDSEGIVEGAPRRLYINERLTSRNRYLLYKTREEAKSKRWRFAWTKNGRIYVRKSSDDPVSRIRNEEDIIKVFGIS